MKATQAARWVIRNRTEKNPESHDAAFQAWLARNPEHKSLYQQAEFDWDSVEGWVAPIRERILNDQNWAREWSAEALVRSARTRKQRRRQRNCFILAIFGVALLALATWLCQPYLRLQP